MDIVHTLGFGLGCRSVGLLRIPHVLAGSPCLQGLECSSSPTSGTVFPRSDATVAEVIQEHIDLLIRPSSGTTKTYRTMLDLHIGNVIGYLPWTSWITD